MGRKWIEMQGEGVQKDPFNRRAHEEGAMDAKINSCI
jgi:hypothetical protein